MNSDSITIGITAYNAADTIAAALDSALVQDVPVAQILVVDDVSSDETVAIVEGYQAREPRIELIRHSVNQGVAAARNTLIENARGTFLAFFDDDDISTPDRLRLQRARIVAYERDHAGGAAVICHTARRQIYPDGTESVEPAMGSGPGMAPHGDAVVRFALMGEPLGAGHFGSCATCSQMARVASYRALGGFDPLFRRGEDTELVIRHARAGGHLVGQRAPLVIQRMTPTSDKSLEKLHEYWTGIFGKHRDAFARPARYAFCKRWMDLKYLWLGRDRAAFARGFAALLLRHPVQTAQRAYRASGSLRRNRVFSRFSQSIKT
ncbi:glycosyltransferase family 2 protein [Roseinatronobacter sp.]|uniref:glycosyltransferase family 2 protein n=1 Tax=Roseinatronobacter sp. TaxID=1945755 RepID=UPI0025FFF746|nr:glycosyltransferase family 2 protein [Roseibaca sp.]